MNGEHRCLAYAFDFRRIPTGGHSESLQIQGFTCNEIAFLFRFPTQITLKVDGLFVARFVNPTTTPLPLAIPLSIEKSAMVEVRAFNLDRAYWWQSLQRNRGQVVLSGYEVEQAAAVERLVRRVKP